MVFNLPALWDGSVGQIPCMGLINGPGPAWGWCARLVPGCDLVCWIWLWTLDPGVHEPNAVHWIWLHTSLTLCIWSDYGLSSCIIPTACWHNLMLRATSYSSWGSPGSRNLAAGEWQLALPPPSCCQISWPMESTEGWMMWFHGLVLTWKLEVEHHWSWTLLEKYASD